MERFSLLIPLLSLCHISTYSKLWVSGIGSVADPDAITKTKFADQGYTGNL
jgi:hypothetical protein